MKFVKVNEKLVVNARCVSEVCLRENVGWVCFLDNGDYGEIEDIVAFGNALGVDFVELTKRPETEEKDEEEKTVEEYKKAVEEKMKSNYMKIFEDNMKEFSERMAEFNKSFFGTYEEEKDQEDEK